jgi:hypothetical protein
MEKQKTPIELTTAHWKALFEHFVDANDDHYYQSVNAAPILRRVPVE